MIWCRPGWILDSGKHAYMGIRNAVIFWGIDLAFKMTQAW
jgi:hypothetical protein